MKDLFKTLDDGEFFWFRCSGPDGLVWLLVRHHNICGHHCVDIPQDAREKEPILRDPYGAYHVHKWEIVQVHAISLPGAARDWVWCNEETRRAAIREFGLQQAKGET